DGARSTGDAKGVSKDGKSGHRVVVLGGVSMRSQRVHETVEEHTDARLSRVSLARRPLADAEHQLLTRQRQVGNRVVQGSLVDVQHATDGRVSPDVEEAIER